jgi:hypothetical protein
MRDLIKTVMTSSMVAGAALLVVACGGDKTEVNNMTVDVNAMDTMMDGTTNDVTAVDGATATDANMAVDANATMDANAAAPAHTTAADANMTNGM